jgi:hypothetical protein
MTTAHDGPQQRIEAYLSVLRRRLRGMNDESAREVVQEMRSHITDKAAANGEPTLASVDAALDALGSPEELAAEYMTDDLLARAEVSRSPVRILESLFRWASLSVAGFGVLMCSIVGYALGIISVLVAVLKTFHPHTAGLWLIPDVPDDSTISLRLGFGSVPASGRELLGWWIVPIGLVVGCGLVTLTTRFALWCAGRYRRSRVM